LNPSGPESYADRILRAVRSFHTDRKPVRGIFIHDLHRMLTNGKRMGPYKTMEWMMAAGYAITEVRRMNGVLPFDVALEAPETARPAEVMIATVTFRGTLPAGPVNVRLFAAPDLEVSSSTFVLTRKTPSFAVKVRWTPLPISRVRGNRTFLAFRAEESGNPEKHPVIQTSYIQGEKPSPTHPAGEEENP
jgi:hypothetical protein